MIQIIENGTVIDGLGHPPKRADVIIEGERILSVGDAPPEAAGPAQRIDAPQSERPVRPNF